MELCSKRDSPQIVIVFVISSSSSEEIVFIHMAEGLISWKLEFNIFLVDSLGFEIADINYIGVV